MKPDEDNSPHISLSRTLSITKVFVLTGRGPDKISLETEHPCPFLPSFDTKPLSLTFEASKGTGYAYCRSILKIPETMIEKIETDNRPFNFSHKDESSES